MKLLSLSACLIALATVPMTTLAEDGWLLSDTPPIVVRYDARLMTFYFTNTSDKPIHGVTLHSSKDGQKTSRVIIDTIEPHKTATVGFEIFSDVVIGATITCTNYSKPMTVPFP